MEQWKIGIGVEDEEEGNNNLQPYNQNSMQETYSQRLERIADKNGFRGFMKWTSGDFYWGEWAKNKRHGVGIHVYKNGNRYEGEWKNGKREGKGIFWTVDAQKFIVHYQGEWKNGFFEGKGCLRGECGEKYDGDFEKGMRHGLGKQTYFSGTPGVYHVYHGAWVKNKRHGIGCLKMESGDVYEGNFIDDVKEGLGVYYFQNISAKYEGVWKEDKLICGSYVKPKSTMKDILSYQGLKNHTVFTQTTMHEALNTTKFSSNG